MDKKIDLRSLSTKELEDLAVSLGYPAFRGRQIGVKLYKQGARSIDELSDLPVALRGVLAEKASLPQTKILSTDASADGTMKCLLGMEDGETVEAVLLPYAERVSTCISSQVGCACQCSFCATGISGLNRNLTAGEMVDEVLSLQSKSDRRISHVVYMGMGEPLLNYAEVLKSIQILNAEVGIAMRHITLSTVGVIPEIDRLAKEQLQLNLAISLHAPTDELRTELIPMARVYPLYQLIASCRKYAEATGRKLTFEYLLIDGINDSLENATQLIKLLRRLPCGINVIPFNPVNGIEMRRPPSGTIRAFVTALEDAGLSVTQRMERGTSISAACGQLRQRVFSNEQKKSGPC